MSIKQLLKIAFTQKTFCGVKKTRAALLEFLFPEVADLQPLESLLHSKRRKVLEDLSALQVRLQGPATESQAIYHTWNTHWNLVTTSMNHYHLPGGHTAEKVGLYGVVQLMVMAAHAIFDEHQ